LQNVISNCLHIVVAFFVNYLRVELMIEVGIVRLLMLWKKMLCNILSWR
jgi:hypothetical protein